MQLLKWFFFWIFRAVGFIWQLSFCVKELWKVNWLKEKAIEWWKLEKKEMKMVAFYFPQLNFSHTFFISSPFSLSAFFSWGQKNKRVFSHSTNFFFCHSSLFLIFFCSIQKKLCQNWQQPKGFSTEKRLSRKTVKVQFAFVNFSLKLWWRLNSQRMIISEVNEQFIFSLKLFINVDAKRHMSK